MSVMAYWPVIAMGITLSTAGMGGYIDLLVSDKELSKDLVSARERGLTLHDITSNRITLANAEIEDQGESIDNNEDAIEEIQRILIQRQGAQDLSIQRIQNDISNQDMKLDQLLQILEQVRQGQ
jgi:hypothetical protein